MLPSCRSLANKSKITEAVSEVCDMMKNTTKPMALPIVARLLGIENVSTLHKFLYKYLDAFKVYYGYLNADTKAIISIADMRMREDPLRHLALIMGLIKYSGAAEDLSNINPYRMGEASKRMVRFMKIHRLEGKLFPELKYIAHTPIVRNPEMLVYLTVNYALQDESSYKLSSPRRGVSALELLIYSLRRRLPKTKKE